MFDVPGSAPLAAVQSIVVAVFLLAFGYLVADALVGRKVEGVVAWGLAFPCIAAFASALTGVHVVTGGALFRSPWSTRMAVVGAFLILFLRRLTARESPPRTPRTLVWAAAGVTLLGVAVWSIPLFTDLPISSGGDTILHTGYTNQFLNGETLPSSAATGEVPNFYPWLTHSITAMTAHFTPGGNAFHALAPLQILQLSGVMLGLVALGSRLGDARTGAAAALLGGVTGGFGFVMLRRIDLIQDVRNEAERYLGDLMERRSYNLSFFNLPPPYPRDVAFTLLIGALVALVVGLGRRDRRVLSVGGVLLGLSGLTGAEAFFVGTGAALLLIALPPAAVERRTLLWFLGPALAVYSIWLVPQAINWFRLGGFVDLTLVAPVTLSPAAIVVSWGVTVPLAGYGIVLATQRWRNDPNTPVLLAVIAAAAIGIGAASLISALFGEAFDALGRAHRYWPLLYLGLALLGAVALTRLLDILGKRAGWAPVAAALLVVCLALPSPVVASLAYAREKEAPTLIRAATRGEPDAVLNILANSGDRCHVAAPPKMSPTIWSYTGFHLVLFVWPGFTENLARIRWADIYDRIPNDRERLTANPTILSGKDPVPWQRLVERFGVDVVVTGQRLANAPAFRGLETRRVDPPRWALVRLGECDR